MLSGSCFVRLCWTTLAAPHTCVVLAVVRVLRQHGQPEKRPRVSGSGRRRGRPARKRASRRPSFFAARPHAACGRNITALGFLAPLRRRLGASTLAPGSPVVARDAERYPLFFRHPHGGLGLSPLPISHGALFEAPVYVQRYFCTFLHFYPGLLRLELVMLLKKGGPSRPPCNRDSLMIIDSSARSPSSSVQPYPARLQRRRALALAPFRLPFTPQKRYPVRECGCLSTSQNHGSGI